MKFSNKWLALLSVAAGLFFIQTAQAQEFSDDFDSYVDGSQMHGQGGWAGWDNNPGLGALVSNAQSFSAPNAVEIVGTSDLIHTIPSGNSFDKWTVSARVYVPSDYSGNSYFILLNTYNTGGPFNWSTQLRFDSALNLVQFEGSFASLPLITEEWVEVRVEINLAQDIQEIWYGGQLLATYSWTNGQSGGGASNLAAIDLYANNASPVYWDNISFTKAPIVPVPGLDLTGLTLLILLMGLSAMLYRRKLSV